MFFNPTSINDPPPPPPPPPPQQQGKQISSSMIRDGYFCLPVIKGNKKLGCNRVEKKTCEANQLTTIRDGIGTFMVINSLRTVE